MLRPMYSQLRAEYPVDQFIEVDVVTQTQPETFYDACAKGNLSVAQSMVPPPPPTHTHLLVVC